jgi:hypothetical protein
MTIGTGERSRMAVAVFRLWGHLSTGPRGVADQSNVRIRAVSSPGPSRKFVADEDVETPTDSGLPPPAP